MANQDNKKGQNVSVNVDALLGDGIPEVETKQVEAPVVIYVPRKDFEARINQDKFYFRAGVPTEVTRDMAAMLLEDSERGYVRD